MAVHNSGQETELEEPQLVLKKELGTLLGTVIKNVRTFWKGVVFASNWHTLTLIVLTCSATLMCSKGVLDFSCSTNMSIVAVGTIFPLVFSVQAAFARREVVLESLAKIKAASFTIYLMFLTWEKEGTGKWASEAEQLIHKLLDDMEWYFRCEKRTEETGNVVYDGFATFAAKMDEFGPKAGFTQGGQGGMSRMTVYLRTIMQEFERIRAIRDTETPVGLRLFCFSLIHFAPIVLAPYWNHFCIEQSGLVEIPSMYGCEAGYFVAVTFVVIVMTLYKVQNELEDPFDGQGDDDIKWEIWRSQLDQFGNYGAEGPRRRMEMSQFIEAARVGKGNPVGT